MNSQEKLIDAIDIEYSYKLAKRMEGFRSNEALGYRSAGSKAELATGELLKAEMEGIGLSNVTKDAITVDGWEFTKAVLTYNNISVLLGAYQTNMVTDGPKPYKLVYAGKGTAADYKELDVAGKLVLVDINQRDEWWINYPVYQAHLKGAAAVIAVQCGGYGEIDDEALNAQDIAGPEDAPAFSISRRAAAALKELLEKESEIDVILDADTRVKRDVTTYNIIGCIPGRHPDRIVMLSAHYDSYFDGFQDDNTAVAMMLGIARAFINSGYTPENTIMVAALAAEEWGVADSNFDWSSGAYEEVFTVHPEWAGKVIADLNFELPALAHGTRARIRSCYEYTRFLNEFLIDLPNLTQAYPEETRVIAPIETWSDDFSIAISGIPSMVNDFTGGSFMETHYHSQFDNDTYYDEQVYRLHHELFALLIDALDHTAVVPLCFTNVFKRAGEILDDDNDFLDGGVLRKLDYLAKLFDTARSKSRADYEKIRKINRAYAQLLVKGDMEGADTLYNSTRELEANTLARFKTEQDTFVRIDWYGNVFYPHELLIQSLMLLDGIIRNLSRGNISSALRKLYQMENNAYAFMFDKEVYDHFSDYVYNQPKQRLKWGYKRLMDHENMYETVTSLLSKEENGVTDYSDEIKVLKETAARQSNLLERTINEIYQTITSQYIL